MHAWVVWLGCGAASYLLGSIPTGFLIARAKGIDIRTVGSGNIGATNVFRIVGKTWGIVTFVADALKGFVPSFVFPLLAPRWGVDPAGSWMGLMCMALAMVGHNWPLFLGFKGGKGVATAAGGLLGIVPKSLGVGLVVWTAVFVLTRYVSLASICVAIAVPCSAWVFYAKEGLAVPIVLSVLGVLVVLRHHGNIRRLLNGAELRFSFTRRQREQKGTPGT